MVYKNTPKKIEYNRKYNKSWNLRNKEHLREYRRKWDLKLRLECIKYYSRGKMCCNCCGETEIRFLCLDHINSDGAEHRKKDKTARHTTKWLKRNKFPKGFQVLCYNCNFGRAHQISEYKGLCPHVSRELS